jgi:parallel beta-helix repeat protein
MKLTSFITLQPYHLTNFSIFCALVWILFSFPGNAHSEVLLQDTVWQGEVLVEDDVLVPQGVTLTIRQGARITVKPAESTRTDPQYMSSMTELTVRGSLVVQGTPASPVIFRLSPAAEDGASWAGILIDGGSARISSGTISDAESGIWIIGGSAVVLDSTLTSNRYGLVAQREAVRVEIANTRITGNDYGLMALNGAVITQKETSVSGNRKMDFHSSSAAPPDFTLKSYETVAGEKTEELVDEVLLGDTVWQGRIRVTGQIRVPVGSRLIIMPGTIVEFTKKDTNGDGIGESSLMMQGVLIAKGTEKKPILFRSAEPEKGRGDWDAINIIGSDGVRNLIEYCQFEDAYRGLHFHFSNVFVQQSVFRNNYRAAQFQESTVELRNNQFYRNISGVQSRDSKIVLTGNRISDNVFGANFLRAHLTFRDNTFAGNLDFGLKVREGYPTLTRNVFHHNRFGLMFSDATYGSVSGNLMARNSETGLSIRNSANMEVSGNVIQKNELSGISLRDTAAVIRENHISENGERGIGLIGFTGSITKNVLLDNALYAIAVEDGSDVSAPLNWYGRTDIEPIIFDRQDDSSRGRVNVLPVSDEPQVFTWPLADLPLDLDWSGRIGVKETVFVPPGIGLTVKPGTIILFRKDAGLYVRGWIQALGTRDKRIQFTALEGKEPSSWDEIRIEYSENSRFSNCDFEYASWGIHSHFNAISFIGCSFTNGIGGIRIRSGPVVIRNSLFRDNKFGIRSFRGQAEITGNIITRNNKGIFVREKGGGLSINGNNIFDNLDYNIWVGDFNTEDVDATGNWWGVDDPTETVFDARREPGIGTVYFDPILGEPLDIQIDDQDMN